MCADHKEHELTEKYKIVATYFLMNLFSMIGTKHYDDKFQAIEKNMAERIRQKPETLEKTLEDLRINVCLCLLSTLIIEQTDLVREILIEIEETNPESSRTSLQEMRENIINFIKENTPVD